MRSSVDICVPVYNAEKTIERTLKSLIAQTYENIHIHVVDNMSTDTTLDVVENMGIPINVHKNTKHTPEGEGNWNRCFQYMQGKYGAIFHSDDTYEPTMIEKQVQVMESNSDVCAVFVNARHIDDNDHLIGTITLPEEYKNNCKLDAKSLLTAVLRHGDTLVTPSPLMRADVFRDTLAPFRFNVFKYSCDLDMWLRAAQHSHIIVIDEHLMNYRVSKNQGSARLYKLRTSEEGIYRVVDHYLQEYPDHPQEALDKYEVRRLNDKLVCMCNIVKKVGWRLPGLLWWAATEKIG